MNEFWVFGYGSLMWNPGFKSHKRAPARLAGYHRSLCIYSHIYRGTHETPGLVLGLDRTGACDGVAFAVKADDETDVMRYLRGRELVTNAYKEMVLPVRLQGDIPVPAVCYVVDRSHSQYAGRLSPEKQLEMTQNAKGKAGSNCDYVLNTVQHLRAMNIHDSDLEILARKLETKAR